MLANCPAKMSIHLATFYPLSFPECVDYIVFMELINEH